MIDSKVKRITLGRYPELTPEIAQKKALEILAQIDCVFFDPVADKNAYRMAHISLKEVFDDYLKARKALKPSTKINYEQVLNKAFTNETMRLFPGNYIWLPNRLAVLEPLPKVL